MPAMQRFAAGAVRLAAAATLLSSTAGCLAAAASNPSSPAPATSASASAREAASRAAYRPVEYRNMRKAGPAIVVLEGDIKSSNASFTQKVTSNAIADYAELELSKANFKVLERSDLGALKREFQIAYLAGDPDSARRLLGKGKFKSTRWIVRFDVLKAEPVAGASSGFSGATLGAIAGSLIGGRAGFATGVGVGSVETDEAARVWLVGMRYSVIDARTTEQVATGYFEQEMEIGSAGTSVLGFSQSQEGGLTLDSLSQRLVQESVAEIDAKYK
jgi:curli biogenesis system outer membrane secretion channel CsgG